MRILAHSSILESTSVDRFIFKSLSSNILIIYSVIDRSIGTLVFFAYSLIFLICIFALCFLIFYFSQRPSARIKLLAVLEFDKTGSHFAADNYPALIAFVQFSHGIIAPGINMCHLR